MCLLLSGPGATSFPPHVPSVYNGKKCTILRTYENNHLDIFTQNTFNATSPTGSYSCSFRNIFIERCPLFEGYLKKQNASIADTILVSGRLAFIKFARCGANFVLYLLEAVTRIRFDTTCVLVVKSCGLMLTRNIKYSKIFEFHPDCYFLCKSDLNVQSVDFCIVIQCSLLGGY
jgi:hypothetical protein